MKTKAELGAIGIYCGLRLARIGEPAIQAAMETALITIDMPRLHLDIILKIDSSSVCPFNALIPP
jgi:hypothetical protein